MTKKLTFRELRKDLSKYLDRMKKGEVFEIKDFLVGSVERSITLKNTDTGAVITVDKSAFGEIVREPKPCEGEIEVITYYDLCYFCRKALKLYSFYQEGSCYEVCEECLTNKIGKKAKKYICEANKIVPQEPINPSPPTSLGPLIKRTCHGKTIARKPVKYCTKCKCQAAQNNSPLCVKCGKKKKK